MRDSTDPVGLVAAACCLPIAYAAAADFHVSDRGHPINRPDRPVARITWQQAMHFCRWLSQQTGNRFTLPTEAQWEWACRAGTAGDFWYGGLDTDFSPFANLADQALAPCRLK